jgi:hypothetical protein
MGHPAKAISGRPRRGRITPQMIASIHRYGLMVIENDVEC